ncbi:hypothetical protein OC842_004010 [Tilletia horrida]|uniref:Sin3 C-terminal domain-containing protein n=1 Tax=Tilletia horrida TaxID=155126 RepID=A0AAN6JJY6_9BASI|nr:hypothetical protein OC842_004010 [Tilletia horrida]KAK0561461.1 hypothetical protein OC844_003193 [Tilletia horrida]
MRYYETLLDLTEKLLENDIDQGVFEESVRFMYGIDGCISFTLNKVVGSTGQILFGFWQVQSITTDLKSQELAEGQVNMEEIRATLEQAEVQVVAMDTDATDEAAAGPSKTEKDALAGEPQPQPQPQPSGEAVRTEDGGEAPKQGLEAEGGVKAAATATAPAADKP